MAYEVTYNTGGSDLSKEDHDSYRVLGNGVLQLITQEKGKLPVVEHEISPNFWNAVSGTRFVGQSNDFEGSGGAQVNGEFRPKR